MVSLNSMGRNTVGRYRSVLAEEGLLEGREQELPPLKALREAVEAKLPQSTPAQQRSSIERWLPIIIERWLPIIIERWLPIIDEKYEAGVGPTAIFDFLRLEHEDFDGSIACWDLRGGLAATPVPTANASPVPGPGTTQRRFQSSSWSSMK